jgi:probable phosphoglycerate mutase
MTTFYLIRHGSNDFFTHTLVGRTAGIHLNEIGRREAEDLAKGLAQERIQKIFASPMERCRETATPLGVMFQLPVEISEALIEVNFGDWTGKKFKDLDTSGDWQRWNTFRSGHRVPNGENMLEIQERMVGLIMQLHRDFRDERIALFSHGEPLRAVMMYFLGTPVECIRRLDISPASVTILQLGDWEAQFKCINVRFGQSQLLL